MTFSASYTEPGLLQRNVSPSIRFLLDAAMKNYREKEKSELMLHQAFDMDPSVLDTYVVYYKFYFYHRLLSEAEEWAYRALENAAQQGGFDKNWECLNEDSAFWDQIDSPERIYLYSLKALAFLRMKQGDMKLPRSLLERLEMLDPQDQVGWSVILQMHTRLSGDGDNDDE